MRKILRWGIVIVFFLGVLDQAVFALEVSRVNQNDGTLQLSDGKKVVLAGLHLVDEAYPVLDVFVKGREVFIEPESAPDQGLSPSPVYLYVEVPEVTLPLTEDQKPAVKKILVNRELIRMGFAQVMANHSFKLKEELLSLQREAEKAGSGLWSFNLPKMKNPPQSKEKS